MGVMPPEPDDDAARLAWAERGAQAAMIAALRRVRMPPRHADAAALRRRAHAELDRLSSEDRELLRLLAWRWRRQLPAHLAPKLPPADPIVRAMEAADG
jgi:hypothetical protein